MPIISVCLPVYNGSKYLAQAIESVLAQTYKDFELLIANDCSTDDSAQIIDSFAGSDRRIKAWRNEKQLGLFENYNACIRRSEGQFVKPFAQDDVLLPTALERMCSILQEKESVSLVACARQWIDADGESIAAHSEAEAKIMKPFQRDTQLSAQEAVIRTLTDIVNWIGEPCSQMFRRTDSDNGYDTSFRQIGDLEYAYRLLQSGDYYFIADELCCFRRHAESSSKKSSFDLAAYLDWFLLAAKYQKCLVDAGVDLNQYCLDLVRSATQNVEYEMQSSGRMTNEGCLNLMRELLTAPPLSFFQSERNRPRDLSMECGGMAVPAFVRCVVLEAELRLRQKEVRKISLEGSAAIKVAQEASAALQGEIQSLQKTIEQKDKEISELRTKLNDMGSSVSWKVTAPLRKIKSRLP